MAPYFLLLFAWPAGANAPPLTQRAGPLTLRWHAPAEDGKLQISFTERLLLSLSAEAPGSVEVRVPHPLVRTPGWREAARGPQRVDRADGAVRWQRDFVLEPLTARDSMLDLSDVQVRIGDAVWRTVSLPPISVHVTTTAVGDETPRDITSIETLPATTLGENRWLPAFAIITLTLAFVGVVLLGRRRRLRVQVTARDRASAELDRLSRLDLLAAGKREQYFTLLSAILRRYLQKRYALPARRRTTPEFLRLASQTPALADDLAFFQSFLTACDRAKFAPPSEDGTLDEGRARELRAWLQRQPSCTPGRCGGRFIY